MSVPRHTFDYAIVRVVPRVERDEFVNTGVILFCPTLEFLGAKVALDRRRLAALAPGMEEEDFLLVERYLAFIPLICAGGVDSGALGRLSPSARFHWLVAPRSHMVQTSPVHSGLCTDPAAALDRLLHTMVHPPRAWHTKSPSEDRPPMPNQMGGESYIR